MPGEELSGKVLLKVSNLIRNGFEVEQLATELDIDENFVTIEREQNRLNPCQIALHALREWKRKCGKRATLAALIQALSNEKLSHLKEVLVDLQKTKKGQKKGKKTRAKATAPPTSAAPASPSEYHSDEQDGDLEQTEDFEGSDSDAEPTAAAAKTTCSPSGSRTKEKTTTGRPLVDRDIVRVSGELASHWLKVARHLPDARSPDKLAFELNDLRLSKIEEDTKGKGDDERLTQIIGVWRGITPLHDRACLYNALKEIDFGTVAEKHLKK